MPSIVALFVLAFAALQSSAAAPDQRPVPGTGEALAADTPRTTVEGNKFIAPAGWRIEVRGPATILEPPEGGSHIALVDVRAKDADSAVAAAWEAYRRGATWPLKVTNDYPDKDGWSNIRDYSYRTSPNEKRDVGANARRAGETWTVVLYDMDQAVGEKRGGQAAAHLMAAGEVFDTAYRSAMGSYYAALLASARRDTDGTARHVMLLKSRWDAVIRLSDTDAPPPLRGDPGWRAALTRVATQADRARQLVSKRDTAGAHAELEAIRNILHEARTRSGVRMFDDDLTEYHEAIERLSGLVGTRNEFRLKAQDFGVIKEQTERARRAWEALESAANPAKTQPAWKEAAARTAAALAAVDKAAAAQDSAGVISAGEQLHTHYFELLAALSGA